MSPLAFMDKTVEIVPTTLTYGGDSMGRLDDGRAVFVPFALPGERVRVRLREEKRSFARAELLEVLTPSPARITPRCAHFGVCGGCHYQHLPYAAQLTAKMDILREQLTRIGRITEPPMRDIVPSPVEWNYRNHVQFHLTDSGRLGFAAAGHPQAVLPVDECHLPVAALDALWPRLEFEPGTPLERVPLRCGVDDELMLMLESQSADVPALELESGISVVHLAGDDAVTLAGEPDLLFEVLGRRFCVSAASFFQVNTAMAAKMVEHVLSLFDEVPPSSTILEVYCGVGLFSAFLAPRYRRLIGVEASPSACEDFAVNLDEFENVELYEAAAEVVLPSLGVRPDAVLVDPPRAGLEKKALAALLTLAAGRLVYVSCDPATLARDARRLLDGGYRLEQVTPFDLFPQTYHIESISLFTRPT